MRVIAGKARRTLLKTPEGFDTRPTTDRTKETLFNILNGYLPDCNFLDLFSGSGAIGIEAISRGAKLAVFSEINRIAIECIKSNLKATHFEENAKVYQQDALSVIRSMEKEGRAFDIIFMDPPYNQALEQEVLEYLEHSTIVSRDTIIVVEASLDTSFDYLENSRFQVYREKVYKTNKHVFIELKEEI
ncbi:16S rRNA (guanine(966)-N(2))-methyltransferase RsmD [Clostridium sp. Marseille-P299]|uniref:16S rRNA (guanine(966)-N(2))-methyltransferase RsmD n=1 Tax=Clostridium sp. Marseille-P299 TaxID=1805477 RepID=UPI000836722F|nr:16S rRNA (guanine(966)-N(2))-methyltransferase RsmD [Clostridium sp. Marseille-P299]